MILLGFIALFLAVGVFYFARYLELIRMKNYAKKIILNSEITKNNSIQIELENSYIENIYWYNFKNNSLNSINRISKIKDSNELKFLNFKYFVNYISSSPIRMKSFINGTSAFVFAPILMDNETKYLVFEKTLNTIENLIMNK